MRVAQRSISRNYMRRLNNSLSKRTESMERGESGLKFSKLSDNVADGSRAMHIQEERYQSTQQLDNTENLLAELKSVDSNMKSIQSVMQTVQERVLKAMSDPISEDGRAVLAKEISNLKDQLLQFANSQFSGKYLFSGTNNSTQPFTVNEETGKFQFNGIDVDSIYRSSSDGKYYYGAQIPDLSKPGDFIPNPDNPGVMMPDPNDPTKQIPDLSQPGEFIPDPAGNPPGEMMPDPSKQVPHSGDVYADIGLGLKITGDVQADPRTAFQISFSGLELLGFGAPIEGGDGRQISSNAYDLLTQIENAITPNYDKEALDDMHKQLVKLTDKVGMNRTDLGTRTNFLEQTKDRLEADIDNMSELESNLVSSDPAEDAIKMKECEYVWLAVLQLGSQILPSSLLDFMR